MFGSHDASDEISPASPGKTSSEQLCETLPNLAGVKQDEEARFLRHLAVDLAYLIRNANGP